MDESRKQFHEWVLSRPEAEHDDIVMRNGEYLRILTSFMWESWQASRAAIEIELPQIRYGYAGNKEYKPEEVVAAIRAAGIKVKE